MTTTWTTTRTTTRSMTGARRARRSGRSAALAVIGALLLGACAAPALPADTPAYTPSRAAPPSPLATPTCANATASYDPLPATAGAAAFPSGSLQAKIRARGRLVVGISGDSLLLGARKPGKPTEFEGFDIDLARAIAVSIFGPGGDSKIQFRVITAAQRIPLVNAGADAGGVDLVARNMTVNCDRWTQVGFSAVYLVAKQRFLVRSDSPVKTWQDLVARKARICATAGSTDIQRLVTPDFAGVVPVQVDQYTVCLALLQQGRVDAITGDSTVLAGLNTQDPQYTRVLRGDVGDVPYGLAVAQKHPEFARYVNAALAQYIASGRWQASYTTYFAGVLGPDTPPAPRYGRPLP